jgi:hypothetical protein
VTYIRPVPNLFSGNGLCNGGPSWFYPLSFNLSLLAPDPGSFHPSQDGQSAYETAFSDQWGS